MIQYTCNTCGIDMESPQEQAGTWQTCPACGAAVMAPTAPPTAGQSSPLPTYTGFENPEAETGNPPPPVPDTPAPANAKRKKGWSNIICGGILIVMGLSGFIGGSIFTGNADTLDTLFDILGIGMIVWGSIQVATSSS